MVDPKNVLEAISPMLDANGGIRELSHVARIVGFMRDNATKLASRCVYLMIIAATKNKEILKKLISTDGWSILSSWLDESIQDENFALMSEILNVFSLLPVDVEVLKKSNSTPKTIAKLAKITDKRYAEIANLCGKIVRSWKNLVRSATEKKEAGENKLVSTGKIDEDSSSADVPSSTVDEMQDAVDTISKPIIPPSISQSSSSVQKPKVSTVKTHPIKFRQTGLEAPTAAAAKRTNAQEDGSAQKKAKLSNSGNVFDAIASHTSNGTTTIPPVTAVKKPAPPPKVVEYRESSGFMDALSSTSRPIPPPATVVISATQAAQSAALSSATSPTAGATATSGLIRRKKRIAPTNLPLEPTTSVTSNRTISPVETPLAEPSPTSISPPASTGPSKTGKKKVWWPDEALIRQVKYFEVDHEPLMHGRHGDDMKKAEMQLDRSALLKAKQVGEQMMLAEQEENDLATAALLRTSPGYSPGSSSPGSGPVWKRLIQIDLPENIANIQNAAGKDSTERRTQADHQLRVLEVVYFIRRDIPDSAAEPNASDMFVETASMTKSIPLEVVPEFPVEIPAIPPVVAALLPQAPPAVTLPGPLSSILAGISGQNIGNNLTPPQLPGSTPPQPMDTTPATAPVPIPPPPGMPFPLPPFPGGDGTIPPPPFPPFDPNNLPFPPMPPGPDGSVLPMPPFPPPPGMFPFPFPPGMPFPPPPGMPVPPIGDANSTTVVPPPPGIPPFPGTLPFPPPPVPAPPPPATTQPVQLPVSTAPPTSTSPPTIVPVGSSSTAGQGLLPTPMDQQPRDYHHNNNHVFERRAPVSIRFPAGIPSKVPFGVCRYFYESGSCPRQHYCKFKHIQKPLENRDSEADQIGGDSPQNNMSGVNNAMPKLATAVAAGRR